MNRAIGMMTVIANLLGSFMFADDSHYAALRGDTEQLQKFLDEGENVDARDEKGWTPLQYAAAAGKNNVVQLLLDKRADIDARDADRETPLHKASHWGRNSTVKLLLDHGADVNAQDNRGETPLHQSGNKQVAHTLIDKGADINMRDYRGRTPLHVAAYTGKEGVVQELVQAGANLLARDSQGKTVADFAGQKVKDVQVGKKIRAYLDKQERLAQQLQNAARTGNVTNIKKALAAGASVNSPDRDGNTPLHLAIQSGNSQAVEYLLEDVPNIKLRIQNNEGKIAIEEAAGQPEMLKLFQKILKIKVAE